MAAGLVVYLVLPRLLEDPLATTSASGYLLPRLGGDRPYFNLRGMLLSVNHYVSSPYLVLSFGAGLLVAFEPLIERLSGLLERPSASRAAPAIMLAWLAMNPENVSLALLLAGGVVLLLAFARRPLAWKLALVWRPGHSSPTCS